MNVQTALFMIAASLILVACGGGGGDGGAPSPEAPAASLTVRATMHPAVKTIAATSAISVLAGDQIDAPISIGLAAGETVLLNDRPYHLLSIAGSTGAGRVTFATRPPSLGELYTSLRLTGNQTATASASESRRQAARSVAQGDLKSSCAAAEVAGLSGLKCSLTYQSENYPVVSLDGHAAASAELSFADWDVISNAGSGLIRIGIDASVALRLHKDTKPLLSEDDVCSSSRPPLLGTRLRILNLRAPTNLPGIFVNVPFCLAFDAKAGIDGKLLTLSQISRVEIAVGGGAAPRITAGTPANTTSQGATADDIWQLFSDDQASLSPVMVTVGASASLIAEIGVEVEAVSLIATGLVNAFSATVDISGTIAPSILDGGFRLGTLQASPLACLKSSASVDYTLSAYVTVPAFRIFVPNAIVGKLYTTELYKRENFAVGLCNPQVATASTILASPNPGRFVTLSAVVSKADPASLHLWDNETPTGSVQFLNALGALLCSGSVDATGQATCSLDFGATGRAESITASYLGDQHFLPSASPAYGLTVSDGVSGRWTGSWQWTSCPSPLPCVVGGGANNVLMILAWDGQAVTGTAFSGIGNSLVGTFDGSLLTYRVDYTGRSDVYDTCQSTLITSTSMNMSCIAHYDAGPATYQVVANRAN